MDTENQNYRDGQLFQNMRCFVVFVTAVCFLFLLRLKWPKNKSFYDLALGMARFFQ